MGGGWGGCTVLARESALALNLSPPGETEVRVTRGGEECRAE